MRTSPAANRSVPVQVWHATWVKKWRYPLGRWFTSETRPEYSNHVWNRRGKAFACFWLTVFLFKSDNYLTSSLITDCFSWISTRNNVCTWNTANWIDPRTIFFPFCFHWPKSNIVHRCTVRSGVMIWRAPLYISSVNSIRVPSVSSFDDLCGNGERCVSLFRTDHSWSGHSWSDGKRKIGWYESVSIEFRSNKKIELIDSFLFSVFRWLAPLNF